MGEQFYLGYPALLWAVWRWRAGKGGGSPRRVPHVLALICLGSLIASAIFTRTDPALAFYLLPTRAWEMALGAFVACAHFTIG